MTVILFAAFMVNAQQNLFLQAPAGYSEASRPTYDCPEGGITAISQNSGDADSYYASNAFKDAKIAAQVKEWTSTNVISKIRFFGGQLVNNGAFTPCDTDPLTFKITFYEDNEGLPGNVITTYEAVALNHTSTGIYALGSPNFGFVYYWDWEPNNTLTNLPETFWFSVQNESPNCWFLWENTTASTAATAIFRQGAWSTDNGSLKATKYCINILSSEQPAAVTNLTATTTDAELDVNLTWTNPTEYALGGSIENDDLKYVKVYMDGTEIHSIQNPTPGNNETHTVTSTTGMHKFTVVAGTDAEAGIPTHKSLWVGEDVPDVVTNVNLSVNDMQTTLSWDAPTKGMHDGYFSGENITYNIIKMPAEILVAEAKTETTFTETFDNPFKGYYKIVAYNNAGKGDEELSDNFTIGNIVTFDFEEGIPQSFTITNEDENGWEVGTNLSSFYFLIPDHTTYAGVNDDKVGSGVGSTSWMILPPMDFSGINAPFMSFESHLKITNNEILAVKVSTDNGVTWTTVHSFTANTPLGWQRTEVDLSTYANNPYVKIAFFYDDFETHGYGWAVDDIIVAGEIKTPISNFATNFNVDMTAPIEEGTFVVGTDKVYVSGNFASYNWPEPGTEAALELTDTDGDKIYSLTVLGNEAGNYEYKYFKNSGWNSGEWDGGDNRSFEIVDANVTLNDVWGVSAVNTLEAEVTLSPNPTNGILKVMVNGNYNVEVMDITGKIIEKTQMSNIVNIDLSSRNAGVYFVRIANEKGNATFKVIKK